MNDNVNLVKSIKFIVLAISILLILSPWWISYLPVDILRDITYKKSDILNNSILLGLPFLGILIVFLMLNNPLKSVFDFIITFSLPAFLSVFVFILVVFIFNPSRWWNLSDKERSTQTKIVVNQFKTELLSIYDVIVNSELRTFEQIVSDKNLISVRKPHGVLWLSEKQPDGNVPLTIDNLPFPYLGSLIPTGISFIDSFGKKKQWTVRLAAEGKIPDRAEFDIGSVLVVVPGQERSGRIEYVKENWSIVEILSFADLYYVDIKERYKVKLPKRIFGPQIEAPTSLKPTTVSGSVSGSQVGDKPKRELIIQQANKFFVGEPWNDEFPLQ